MEVKQILSVSFVLNSVVNVSPPSTSVGAFGESDKPPLKHLYENLTKKKGEKCNAVDTVSLDTCRNLHEFLVQYRSGPAVPRLQNFFRAQLS